MKHAGRAAYWSAPSLLCLAVWWYGLNAWFQADDFAWLGLGMEVEDWRSLLNALFSPRAQGTIRPWSERAFFIAFYGMFGLDALPFRIWVFLTQFGNLLLVASIAGRLAGSRAAGLLAAVFWGVNASAAHVLSWTSAYNQALCAFFLLLAFHFLLRFVETGRRRYEVLQWAVFLLGFGAQEANLVYPALAGGYTFLCARRYFLRTLPMFAVSAGYAALHMWVAPPPESGVYVMHFTGAMFQTLGTYWSWTVAPPWLRTPWRMPVEVLLAAVAAITAVLLAFVAWRARRRDWLPVFFVLWYLAAIAPVLPLRDRVSEYYPFIPSIGIAMLGGMAFMAAWRGGTAGKGAAVALSGVYLAMAIPTGRMHSEWMYARGERVERLVLGLERARELHPRRTILLHGVDDTLFWMGVLDRPYRLFGAQVFLTPGSEKSIQQNPDYGDVKEFILPAEATARALDNGSVVVYDARGERLRNITTSYAKTFHEGAAAPRRIDLTSPLVDYLLGEGWYEADPQTRWMRRKATLRIGGPATPGEKLWLRGLCPPGEVAKAPVDVTVTAGGVALAPARITPENASFEFVFDLPKTLAGREWVEIGIAVSRTFVPPGDGRELGLAFGTVEVR